MRTCYGLNFREGASALFALEPSKSLKRRYNLYDPVAADFLFDDGTLRVCTLAGFMFDGRSGPPIIDFYVPNLGTLEERALWWMHDCLGYGQSLSFKDTNRALRIGLRDLAGWNPAKALLVEKAVSLSKSWYGTPKATDWCYMNIGKVNTTWIPAR